ncbi:MAG TPA: MarR family transcriptional regulator [Acidobacteriota bacterium]|nr:MarR family transcriptional regulator [Acidobacteriota bacterium]
MNAYIRSICIILAMCVLSSVGVFSQSYVDQQISLNGAGVAIITGDANVDIGPIPQGSDLHLQSTELTKKSSKYWTFSYASAQDVSVSLIKVQLPAGAVVNYVKSPSQTLIEADSVITLTFIGSQEPVNISIQYSINDAVPQSDLSVYFLTGFILIALGVALVILNKRQKKSMQLKDSYQAIYDTLNDTQKQILDALKAHGGKATQNALFHQTQIPKASLSRNVDLLVEKQILIKITGGYTNTLAFHQQWHK